VFVIVLCGLFSNCIKRSPTMTSDTIYWRF